MITVILSLVEQLEVEQPEINIENLLNNFDVSERNMSIVMK